MRKNGNNLLYPIIRFVRLVVRIRATNPQSLYSALDELVAKDRNNFDWGQLGDVLHSEDLRNVLFYFLDCGAATALTIQTRLKLGRDKTYRYLKKLERLGIIEPAVRMQKERPSKGGPRATVHKVPDATVDQVHEAIKIHRRLLSPKYRLAEEMAQLILDEYIEPRGMEEISYREILVFLREKRVTFVVADIAQMAARNLHEKGIKVWKQ